MSHSHGAVRTSSGLILFYEYNGTVDVTIPHLYDTVKEVDDNWRKTGWRQCECKPAVIEDAEIATTYGRGFSWHGKVCIKCKTIVDGHAPYELAISEDEYYPISKGLPDWYPDREIYK